MINASWIRIVNEPYLQKTKIMTNFRHAIKKTDVPIKGCLHTLRGGLSGANASATNCGPRAEPPIPTESICVKRPSGEDGGLICGFISRHQTQQKEN